MNSDHDRAAIQLDGGGRIIDAPTRVAASLGLERQRLIGRALWDVAVPASRRDRQKVRRHGTASLDAFLGATVDVDVASADGSMHRRRVCIAPATAAVEAAYVATLLGGTPTTGARDAVPDAVAPSGNQLTQAVRTLFGGADAAPAPAAAPAVPETPAPPSAAEPAAAPRQAAASALERVLEDALAGAAADRAVALLRVRLIDLPLVTEALGRPAGDALLDIAEQAVKRALPEAALVARVFGGDICVVMTRLPQDGRKAAGCAADRALEHLSGTVEVDGEDVRLSAAIGVALASEEGVGVYETLGLAERGARETRAAERDRVRFATTLPVDRRGQLRVRAHLENVADRGELRLFYQPIFDLTHGSPYGVEALLRWQHPERGLVSPDEFIPVAEETGAIDALGTWVIEELCRQARRWHEQNIRLKLHFNVSALELDRPDFARRTLAIIRRHLLPPSMFTLEVTESTAVLRADTALPALCELRGAGMHIAIDDFGAGHSSLSRLKDLPADVLKVDRALIAGLPNSGASKALVIAALDIAEALKMRMVAEGIESDAQRKFLADAGCPLGQGFALGGLSSAVAGPVSTWSNRLSPR